MDKIARILLDATKQLDEIDGRAQKWGMLRVDDHTRYNPTWLNGQVVRRNLGERTLTIELVESGP
jgi:hypothetical protein